MTDKIKKQHYVPRLYLKGFANKRKKEFHLFVYNKENNKVFNSNIRNIAQESYFYDVDEAQTVERIFGQLESQFNIALQKIIDYEDLDKLNLNDKEMLSTFIAIQLLRTKEHRTIFKEASEAIFNIVGKDKDPNFKEGSVTLTEEYLKSIHISSIFKDFGHFSEIILNDMAWKLCINNTDIPFWTSDNPCVFYNELEPEGFKGNLGLKCKGFQLHFPLSHKLLLILMEPSMMISDLTKAKKVTKDFKKKVSKMNKTLDRLVVNLIPDKEIVNEERVIFENNLQVISSTQFILSKDNNFELADKYLKENPHFKDKNRKRMDIS